MRNRHDGEERHRATPVEADEDQKAADTTRLFDVVETATPPQPGNEETTSRSPAGAIASGTIH